jgi:thymidylate synthase
MIDRGSYAGQQRLEFDYITINIAHPAERPLLPTLPVPYNIPDPVDEEYLVDKYIVKLMSDVKGPNESYTYGSRLVAGRIAEDIVMDHLNHGGESRIVVNEVAAWDPPMFKRNVFDTPLINQIELVVWTYKNKGHRNNQMVLQVARPDDLYLQDPPCLRHIDTRVQDGELHFIVYFRSWDLWGGFPANLGAILMLQEYMAQGIGVEVGSMVVSSKGLHLYDYVWELAEILRGKTIADFREGR